MSTRRMNEYEYIKYVDELNNLAEDIVKITEVNAPVTDMRVIVEKLGGKIILNDKYLGLPSDNKVRRDGPDSFTIVINPYDNRNDKDRNWVLGRCLGILFLNMGYLINPEFWNKWDTETFYNDSNRIFNQRKNAINMNNQFALALMFPKTMFTELVKKHTDGNKVDMSAVAKELNCSVTPAISRAEDLRLIKRWYE